MDRRRHYAVLGGGISGLAAAHRIVELDPAARVTLFEANDRLGGLLQTTRQQGFLTERSADNFITNVPWAIDLARRVGFSDQLIPTTGAQGRVLVVCRGRLEEVPAGFVLMAPREVNSILASPILSWAGKLRLAWEWFEPPRISNSDESVADFARRRLGREAFERLVQPLIGGIYTADPERLSMAATMPQFCQMEREHGSLARAAWQSSKKTSGEESRDSGARYSLFVAPREGMSSFVEAIVRRLPPETVRLSAEVERLSCPAPKKWSVHLKQGGEQGPYDGLIVATPATKTAELLQSIDEALAERVRGIKHASTAIVLSGYREEQFERPLSGFGFVVPAIERRSILAVSYSSMKYMGRAPQSCTLLRTFVGGALQPEMAALPDDELLSLVSGELHDLLALRGSPLFSRIIRFPSTMPQYHLGHVERVDRIERHVRTMAGLELAGNAYRGVGIPHCIHSGETAAERLLEQAV